ncbi:15-cis-phytoene desaturase [Polystyrenella longa]|uniref:15-cis-phytoene desaturase n=1 Tax=Polystyrenella longa TaxID=2528007 RepID=A0A518CJ65_9PLAN|nr:hydroxysqualene dehydroxylase HpnE [Polystyrenella longa]QDU79268.1 15-cis-phytoene desaturase [Polystyrenella longa]
MNQQEAHPPVPTSDTSLPRKVAIFGGGLAGLAAAQSLSAKGMQVDLYEARPRLGGRASSFIDQTTGEQIDNCQHVAMGCCTNFFHFCKQAGIGSHFRRLETLHFVDQQGRRSELKNGPWPAPFHLTGSFLRMRHFRWRERGQIALAMRQLMSTPTSDLCFEDWLNQQQQSDRVLRDFWHVILVSALSESLDRIPYSAARQVFVQGFLSHRDAWKVSLPTVPLHELYGETLQTHLQEQGVTLHLQSRIKELTTQGNSIKNVVMANEEQVSADAYVLATPWTAIPKLFPTVEPPPRFIQQAEQLESAPISSVHLWFNRSLSDETHAVLLGRVSQWIFNRSAIQNIENPERHYYQIVISQSRELSSWSQDEIVQHVLKEIASVWPESMMQAQLVHSRVVREHHAVFSIPPDAESDRPDQVTEYENLLLAGDWTETGWPATMEGAVRSGYLAAEKLLQVWGIPARILQPDLPRSGFINHLGLIRG